MVDQGGILWNSGVYLGIHGMTRLHDAARYRARSNLYTVAVQDSCTNIPLAADKGSSGRDHSARAAF